MNKNKAILSLVKDKGLRRSIESILNEKIIKVVTCTVCGRHIADITVDSSGNEKVKPVIDSNGKMWLLASRQRLDGYIGFQCLCGNDSRLAEQEIGVKGLENNAVTKSDIEEVWNRLQRKPAKFVQKGDKLEVNKFIIENIK